jgi:hypothetical protein
MIVVGDSKLIYRVIGSRVEEKGKNEGGVSSGIGCVTVSPMHCVCAGSLDSSFPADHLIQFFERTNDTL